MIYEGHFKGTILRNIEEYTKTQSKNIEEIPNTIISGDKIVIIAIYLCVCAFRINVPLSHHT